MTFRTESCNRSVALKGRDMNDFLNTYSLHLTVQNALAKLDYRILYIFICDRQKEEMKEKSNLALEKGRKIGRYGG